MVIVGIAARYCHFHSGCLIHPGDLVLIASDCNRFVCESLDDGIREGCRQCVQADLSVLKSQWRRSHLKVLAPVVEGLPIDSVDVPDGLAVVWNVTDTRNARK